MIDPNVRDAPPPRLCTPDTSRAEIPAIFCTTESAIEVLPCEVTRSPADDVVLSAELVTGVEPLCVTAVIYVFFPS